jgi:hypothetical protein
MEQNTNENKVFSGVSLPPRVNDKIYGRLFMRVSEFTLLDAI